MAAFIGRTFSIDPVVALSGPTWHVALRLAAANQVVRAFGGTAPTWDAAGIPPGAEG